MLAPLLRAATLGVALLLATPALAGSGKSIAVRYGDLDLTAAAGKHTFERRIARAATAVCGGAPESRDLAANRAHGRCVASALESARPAIDLALRNAATRQLAARDQNVRVAP